MSVTIAEVAGYFSISPFTVKAWVARGQLVPLRRGANPLRFDEDDVVECWNARYERSGKHARRDRQWAEVQVQLPRNSNLRV